MAKLKLTKQELRAQQIRLKQLQRYLPTLQLRKSLLQAEVISARNQRNALQESVKQQWDALAQAAPLLGLDPGLPLQESLYIQSIERTTENIAGVELPLFSSVSFRQPAYDLYDTPSWFDSFIEAFRAFRSVEIRLSIAEERLQTLTKELREVYIRVNLFEKILIPRCNKDIAKIKISLQDMQLAAISQAKMAKKKILARKEIETALESI